MSPSPRGRLVALDVDLPQKAGASALAAHERQTAEADLLAENRFAVQGHQRATYRLHLAVKGDAFVFALSDGRTRAALTSISLGLQSLRRRLPAYWAACEGYYEAAQAGRIAALEEMDAHRRRLHEDGALHLQKRLAPALVMDKASARRLFTLLAVLQRAGKARGDAPV